MRAASGSRMRFRLLRMTPLIFLFAMRAFAQQEDLSGQLLTIKRVYVDKLTGGETAAQMRELLISSLQKPNFS